MRGWYFALSRVVEKSKGTEQPIFRMNAEDCLLGHDPNADARVITARQQRGCVMREPKNVDLTIVGVPGVVHDTGRDLLSGAELDGFLQHREQV